MTTDETRTQVTAWNTEQVAYWKQRARDAEDVKERVLALAAMWENGAQLGLSIRDVLASAARDLRRAVDGTLDLRALDGPDSHETQEGA